MISVNWDRQRLNDILDKPFSQIGSLWPQNTSLAYISLYMIRIHAYSNQYYHQITYQNQSISHISIKSLK